MWISVLEQQADSCTIVDLFQVQNCPTALGGQHPFRSLAQFLQSTEFVAAGIDAPFSVPAAYVPGGTHSNLLNIIARVDCLQRPFPTGGDLISVCRSVSHGEPLPDRDRKVYRETDQLWIRRGLNVRPTLWNGPRGGAPFTAACLSFLGQVGLPIWPWSRDPGRLMVEAFPSAQLSAWRLPTSSYNGADDDRRRVRQAILDGIQAKADLKFGSPAHIDSALNCADALDAVICAFSGAAVADHRLADEPSDSANLEGWIAVKR